MTKLRRDKVVFIRNLPARAWQVAPVAVRALVNLGGCRQAVYQPLALVRVAEEGFQMRRFQRHQRNGV